MNALRRKIAGALRANEDGEGHTSPSFSHPPSNVYAENQRLNRQIKAFVAKIRQNEEKLKRFQILELRLISCTSLLDLFNAVIHEYRSARNLDRVAMTLFDPEYEIRRLLEDEGVDYNDHPDLLFTEDRQQLEQYFNLRARPLLGPYDPHTQSHFFNPDGVAPSSVAIIPMLRHGEIIGVMSLGSRQNERFVRGTASDFLERFATIVSVCLQNVKNHEQLKRVGLTDVLTGLNNRRFFDQRLQEEVASVQRFETPLSCLFFDVDHFKKINDQYGHQAGDIVLKEVASIIRHNLRTTDVLARYGGEEFAALLPNTEQPLSLEIAQRIRSNIAQTEFKVSDDIQIRVTISIGLETIQTADIGANPLKLGQQLVQKADDRLYLAKRSGRNRVVGHTDAQQPEVCES